MHVHVHVYPALLYGTYSKYMYMYMYTKLPACSPVHFLTFRHGRIPSTTSSSTAMTTPLMKATAPITKTAMFQTFNFNNLQTERERNRHACPLV